MSNKDEPDFSYDLLHRKINKKVKVFATEANRHKLMYRTLWGTTSVISILLAISTNFDYSFWGVSSSVISGILAIILPVIMAYTVLRSPEKLWIFEIRVRNNLNDLLSRLELALDKDPAFDRSALEEEFAKIMSDANKEWCEIRKHSSDD
ncbi:hypothetical protein [Glaciecola sp. 1036]|uniref:hypothetical protein n=1 Tax=Alteromonadaceae TaxID=72275 RepID=UPI003D04A261